MTHPYMDLHCHSTRSDGKLNIAELVRFYDTEKNVGVLAITDHDALCPDNLKEYEDIADGRVTLVRGTEISASYDSRDQTKTTAIHIVGLFYRKNAAALQELAEYNRILSNEDYVVKTLQKLEQCNMPIGSYESLYRKYDRRLETVDLARELSQQWNISIDEAYDTYLSVLGAQKAYVPNRMAYPPMSRVVSAILQDGGLPILAHPFLYQLTEQELEELIQDFRTAAGSYPAGVEGWYSRYADHLREPYFLHIQKLAQRHGLLLSAGSDFHGNAEEDRLLDVSFPVSIYETLKQAHQAAFPETEL